MWNPFKLFNVKIFHTVQICNVKEKNPFKIIPCDNFSHGVKLQHKRKEYFHTVKNFNAKEKNAFKIIPCDNFSHGIKLQREREDYFCNYSM